MRRLLAVLPLILLATQASATPHWITFHDPDGAFRVSMPETPKPGTDSVDNTDGNKVGMLEYTIDHGSNAMIVIVSDLTRYPNADRDQVIEGAVGGASKSGTVQSDDPMILDGQHGREVKIVDKDGNNIDDRIFFVGGKLYQVMYVTPANATPAVTADMKRYTNSFHFTKH
jgi:hypothetical protein